MCTVRHRYLENNIKKYQEACNKNKKELWPMVKTHKSTEIARMQFEAGAKGFLCGTIDECESLYKAGFTQLMYAYPVASPGNIKRILELSKSCNFIIRLDNLDSAKLINDAASKENIVVNCSIIINSGLNRFGIAPENAGNFAVSLGMLKNINVVGISTHAGQAYNSTNDTELQRYSEEEKLAMEIALNELTKSGQTIKLVTSGSTPTYLKSIDDKNIKVYHPGNYVFFDNIQIANGTATEDDCALTVLATIISNPSDDTFIIDAGSKTLGLDKGAHDFSSISGYGHVKGHPELTITSLSEEVGKVSVKGKSSLKVGDRIEIIPNHSCNVCNLTSYLIGYRGNKIEKEIEVDMRSNSNKKVRDI